MEKSKLQFVGKMLTTSSSHLDGCLLFNTAHRGKVLDIAVNVAGIVIDIMPTKERKALKPCLILKPDNHYDEASKALKYVNFREIENKTERYHSIAEQFADTLGIDVFRKRKLLIKQLLND